MVSLSMFVYVLMDITFTRAFLLLGAGRTVRCGTVAPPTLCPDCLVAGLMGCEGVGIPYVSCSSCLVVGWEGWERSLPM